MKKSPVIRAVIGFVMLIVTFIIVIIHLITMIGIPIAMIYWAVSYSLGRQIGKAANVKYGDMVLFLIGFVALDILYLIPFVGGFIKLVAVSPGFDTLLYAILNNWVRLQPLRAAST
jgi:hypothetical protein